MFSPGGVGMLVFSSYIHWRNSIAQRSIFILWPFLACNKFVLWFYFGYKPGLCVPPVGLRVCMYEGVWGGYEWRTPGGRK